MPHIIISFATTDLCDLDSTVCSYYDISFEWRTTNSIEGSELTGGHSVICPCLLGFFKTYVLYSLGKRHTYTKAQDQRPHCGHSQPLSP